MADVNPLHGQEFLRVGDLPDKFMDETGFLLADYSVALGATERGRLETFKAIGSGVLVRKGNHHGILTARHCIHSPNHHLHLGAYGVHSLHIIIRGGRGIIIPPEIQIEHSVATPEREDFGLDLTFVEILPSPVLGTIKAVGSFWSLDKDFGKILETFGKVGTPFTVVGFPEVHYNTRFIGKALYHKVKHMTYYYAIQEKSVFERNGWDYIEANCWYGDGNPLPETFRGVSGGPLWGLEIMRDKADRKLKLKNFALIGIAYLETELKKEERQIRGHFIRSIYDVAWRNVKLD